jgi:hypothetical protein
MVREFCVKNVNGSSRVLREKLRGFVTLREFSSRHVINCDVFDDFSRPPKQVMFFTRNSHTCSRTQVKFFTQNSHAYFEKAAPVFHTSLGWPAACPRPARLPPTRPNQSSVWNSWSPSPTPSSDTLVPASLPDVSSVRVPAASPREQNPCRVQSFSTGLVQDPKPCNSLAIPGPCPIALQTSD